MIPEYAVAKVLVDSLAFRGLPFPPGWEHSDCIVTDRNPLIGKVFVKGEYVGTYVAMRARHRMHPLTDGRSRRALMQVTDTSATEIDYIPMPWPLVG